MCEKYLNEKLIEICSKDSCNCSENCGNACNHCPYSDNFNYENYSNAEIKEIVEEEETKVFIYNFCKKMYLKADINEIIKFENIKIAAEYWNSKVLIVKMNKISLRLEFYYNKNNIIDSITLN